MVELTAEQRRPTHCLFRPGQYGTNRGPGKACFQILRRISGGSLGNTVKTSSVSAMAGFVVSLRLGETGICRPSVGGVTVSNRLEQSERGPQTW
jgi:hypothetical protein